MNVRKGQIALQHCTVDDCVPGAKHSVHACTREISDIYSKGNCKRYVI